MKRPLLNNCVGVLNKFYTKILPPKLRILDRIITNREKPVAMINDKLYMCDILVFSFVSGIFYNKCIQKLAILSENAPLLKELCTDLISQNPNLELYLAKRLFRTFF